MFCFWFAFGYLVPLIFRILPPWFWLVALVAFGGGAVGATIAFSRALSPSFGLPKTGPELLTVLADPPRYRVPLAKVTPGEPGSALSAVAPATVVIEILP